MLEIKNLHVSIEGKEILKGINLSVKPGEIHAVMGTNGAGKSTLANVISGNEKYKITRGTITYRGEDLTQLTPENRAWEGIFQSFQYPVVIPGVNNMYFLKTALNSLRKYRGEEELDAMDFMLLIRKKLKLVDLDESFIHRPVNEGFSGGEKKRNEILQMITLEPRLSILDETDSGLDIDALKTIADGVNNFRDEQRSFIVITHYQRLLNYLIPDHVHVLIDGRIVKSGGKELAYELEEKGYAWLENPSTPSGLTTAAKTAG
ncbi:MAG: Fe-S cluster assembly ATPase SufC [FCB group bacterium]|nr:Fe-S cluster assembly ATPase SufC [FCB group bacterium]